MNASPREVKAKRVADTAHLRMAQTVIDLVTEVPDSTLEPSPNPDERAQEIARKAKRTAAAASAALALPPGPLNWLTLVPDLIAVWKIQRQMVADIAAVYGHEASLRPEHMLLCLFKHTGAQMFRDLVMRVGERYLVRKLPIRSLYSIANKIGIKITQRSLGRAVSRVVPVAGAVGVAAYTWYDTRQVAKTAIDLFSHDLVQETSTPPSASAPVKKARAVKKAAPRKRAPAKKTAAKKAAARKP